MQEAFYTRMARGILLIVSFFAFNLVFVTSGLARNWYVDGRDGAKDNSGTRDSPFLFLWQALHKVEAGDTILVVPSIDYPRLSFVATGTQGASITLAGADPNRPTRVTGPGDDSGIWLNGDYLTVRNFDVSASGAYSAVSIAPNHHHITVASNVIHDAGGNGVNAVAADYVTISHNIVYGNANDTTLAFGSGISILGSVDIDNNTGVKMIIDGNIVYANTNTPSCATDECLATWSNSDGSGIILDDNDRVRWGGEPYRGATLISNNVVHHNGGRGIHIYKSRNVTITGNTAYLNNQDPYEGSWRPGEINVLVASNIGVYNNILSSDGADSPIHGGTAPNTHVCIAVKYNTGDDGPIVVRNNICYNPQKDASLTSFESKNVTPVFMGPNIFAGPKLAGPSSGDFRVRDISPAIGTAEADTSVAVDILGEPRGAAPSIGAYQSASP